MILVIYMFVMRFLEKNNDEKVLNKIPMRSLCEIEDRIMLLVRVCVYLS